MGKVMFELSFLWYFNNTIIQGEPVCRQIVEVDNPYGKVDIYILRRDAEKFNKQFCDHDCFYLKIGELVYYK